MDRTTIIIAIVLGMTGACRSSRAEEQAMETEEIEASAGDETSLANERDDQMDGWVTPSDEIEAAAEDQR